MTDVFDKARAAISRSLIERYFSVDKSYWDKDEFYTLNPLRVDKNIGSFSINEGGYYKDFASKEKGDFIDLVSKKFNLSLLKTAEMIIKDTGGIIEHENESRKNDKSQKNKKKEKPPIYPIPETEFESLQKFAGKEYFLTAKKGPPWDLKKFYAYRNYNNDIIFIIGRYERPNQKNPKDKNQKKFIPFWLQEGPKWRAIRPEYFMPFPLYGINKIFDNNDPVIIVSGEECTNVELDEYNIITYQGGDNRVKESDWKTLKDRKIIIWPDNDTAGYDAAKEIRNDYLPHAIILDIKKQGKPKGWDIKNAQNEGIDILDFINNCDKITEENDMTLDPFYAYKQYIKEIYEVNNLQQIDGIFWRYIKNKHYWEMIDISNIKSDFQIWMQKSGLIEILTEEKKAKRSFQSQSEGFINNHSLGYYEDNPFKDSAIQPYIHMKNGAIEILEKGHVFHDREEKEDNFFKELYPVTCFDYNYDIEKIEKVNFDNIGDYAPLFIYILNFIIPDHAKKIESERIKTIKFICQIIAYSLSPIKPRDYFFAFYGDQGTSKTLIFRIIKLFIGEKFIVYRETKDMDGNRFATSDLWGSKIFIDDDLGARTPLPDSFIKKYSGNKDISVENKFKSTQHGIKISITMFFISNYEFKVSGSEGLKRRAIIIKFSNKVNENNMDGFIPERIKGKFPHDAKTPNFDGISFDERPYILALVMKSWEEFRANNNIFTIPDWVKGASDELMEKMTSPGAFVRDAMTEQIDNLTLDYGYSRDEMYNLYKEWCSNEGRKPKGQGNFTEELKKNENIEYVKHSKYRRWAIKSQKKEEINNEDLYDKIPF